MQELSSRLLTRGLVFGEGPRWRDGKLYVSDMHAGRVVAVGMDGGVEEIVSVPNRPSGLGWLPDGRMLIVSMEDSQLVTVEGGGLKSYCDLAPHCTSTPNDMVVDEKGRAYVGNFGFDLTSGEDPKSAELVLVENGEARQVADDLNFPNGTVITPDGRMMIIAESFGSLLTAFDIDPNDGSLSNRRVWASTGERTPDGICLDAEGAIWISSFMTGEYVRLLEGGEVTHSVKTEGGHPAVACMLGGPDGKTLFMLTSDTDIERLAKSDSECRIEVCEAPAARAGLP